MNARRYSWGMLVAFSVCAFAGSAAAWGTLPMTFTLGEENGRTVPLQNGRVMISFDPQDRPRLDLAGTWRKKRVSVDHDLSLSPRDANWFDSVADEIPGATQTIFDDSSWDTHTLPGVENKMPSGSDNPIGAELVEGGVYYRRTVSVPAAWQGQVVRLVTLAADYVADVWVNGDWVGYHEGGYAPFAFDISDRLNYGGENVIVYRVDTVPWALRMDVLPNLFATDWMHYVGVVQDLYLEASPRTHIVRADVIPRNTAGDLDVAVVVENRNDVYRELTARIGVRHLDRDDPEYLTQTVVSRLGGMGADLDGTTERSMYVESGGASLASFDVRVVNPALWTPADPELYALRVELLAGGDVVDTFETQFGIRTVEVGPEAKILVNSRPAFFTGVARHEDWPDSGRTATVEKIADDLEIIHDTNVHFIRTAHYPNHPATYLLTDRVGFAVWEEIPAWWMNQVSSQVVLSRGLALQMWREMIWNGRNRPSILFWSLLNEPMWYLIFNLPDYINTLHEDLDGMYPDGRLVSQSPAADGAPLTAFTQSLVDVAGWTMYFGVFYGDDITGDTTAFLENFHEQHPDLPVIVTEFGYWSNEDGSEESYQVEIAEKTLEAMLPLGAVDQTASTTPGYLAAVTWWCQFNWYRVSEGHIQSMGLMHMDRESSKPVRGVLADLYAPFFESGGLGASIGDDDSDDDASDDDTADDDATDDDASDDDAGDDDDGGGSDDDDDGCGC